MDKKRLGLWAPILVLAAALVMLAVSTGTVEAGKGGNTGSSYTVSVSPNPAPYGTSAFVISGSGFKANSVVSVNVSGMLCCGMSYTDSSGSFSHTWNRMLMPDTYSVYVARLRGNSWVPATMTTFTVTP